MFQLLGESIALQNVDYPDVQHQALATKIPCRDSPRPGTQTQIHTQTLHMAFTQKNSHNLLNKQWLKFQKVNKTVTMTTASRKLR